MPRLMPIRSHPGKGESPDPTAEWILPFVSPVLPSQSCSYKLRVAERPSGREMREFAPHCRAILLRDGGVLHPANSVSGGFGGSREIILLRRLAKSIKVRPRKPRALPQAGRKIGRYTQNHSS